MMEDLDSSLSSFSDVGTVFEKNPEPKNFVFSIEGKELLTIKPDGTIEPGPAFTTTDEASLKFWEVLSKCFPVFLQEALRARSSTPSTAMGAA